VNYFSDKVIKNSSRIHGRGLFAIAAIAKGEIVVVKGGVVMSRARRDELEKTLGPFDVQIGDDLFIGPDTPQTLEAGMMNLNHSCDPNVVFEGQITFVAWRDIAAGEELTLDYATGDDVAGGKSVAKIGAIRNCRKNTMGILPPICKSALKKTVASFWLLAHSRWQRFVK
jgi:hypothetical protein